MNLFYVDVENDTFFVIVRKARLSLQLVNATVKFWEYFVILAITQVAKEG